MIEVEIRNHNSYWFYKVVAMISISVRRYTVQQMAESFHRNWTLCQVLGFRLHMALKVIALGKPTRRLSVWDKASWRVEGMLWTLHLSGVDETDVLKKKAQSMLPDLNLVLEQLKSGNEGALLSDSSVLREARELFEAKLWWRCVFW